MLLRVSFIRQSTKSGRHGLKVSIASLLGVVTTPFPDGINAWVVRRDTLRQILWFCQHSVPLLLHVLVLHQRWCELHCFWSASVEQQFQYSGHSCFFAEFTCSLLVSFWRAILDHVCWVHEILPLWSRSCQWSVKYTVTYGKMNLVRTQLTLCENTVRLVQKKIQCKTL